MPGVSAPLQTLAEMPPIPETRVATMILAAAAASVRSGWGRSSQGC